jgi:hypothetical protein
MREIYSPFEEAAGAEVRVNCQAGGRQLLTANKKRYPGRLDVASTEMATRISS